MEDRMEMHKKVQELRKNYLEESVQTQHRKKKKERLEIEISIASLDGKVVHTIDFVDRSYR